MISATSLTYVFKILILSSVTFVWGVRYQNIIEEFKRYNYPDWLRDLVGILKIACVILILNTDREIVRIGAAGISLLMIAAIITHLRVNNAIYKMVPSICLLIFGSFIYWVN